MIPQLRTLVVGLALVVASCSTELEPVGYRFYLDGEAIVPEITFLVGTPERPSAGDVVSVGRFQLVLDEAGDYRFHSTPGRELYREFEDGRRALTAFALDARLDERLAEPGALAEVRGLQLHRGWEDHAELLDRVDLASCVLDFGPGRQLESLAALPETVRYLDLAAGKLETLDTEPALVALRMLRLPDEREIESLGCIAQMRDLRLLDITGTGITDLRPLGALSELREVRAQNLPVTHLPTEALPKLRRFLGIDWPCADDEIQSFKQLNAHAAVVCGPRDLLRASLQSASRVEIRLRRSPQDQIKNDAPDFESDSRLEVQELIDLLQPIDQQATTRADAGTEWRLAFYRSDGRLLDELRLIEGRILAGRAVGTSAKSLSEASLPALREWLAERDIELSSAD
jgi:hypothetical protein